jgi:hypothetical protein
MARFIDARIPVVFGGALGAKDAVLAPDATWGDSHPIACACCVGRGPAAQAMDRLFLDRVRGTRPWFDRLVVDPAGEAAVRAALAEDAVVSARFRLGSHGST